MEPRITSIPAMSNPRVIEFDIGNESKGFHTLMLSKAPIKVIGKNRYVVSDVHCDLLQKKGIAYKVIK